MDLGTIYSNVETYEESVTSSTTKTFGFYARRLLIVNDSSTRSLTFYPKNNSTGITLKPTETITLDRFRTDEVRIEGTAVPFRLWVFG